MGRMPDEEISLGLRQSGVTIMAQGRFRQKDGTNVMSAWQNMDTAPKDGTEVLLRVKMRAGIPNGHLVGHYMAGGHCIEDHPPIDAGWYFWNGCMFDNAAVPFEWHPLPQ